MLKWLAGIGILLVVASIVVTDIYVHGRWYKFLAWPEGITVWALILTLVAFVWQGSLMAKHAEHLGNLADTLDDTSKLQLRAYLTVAIGQAVYQERRTEENGGDLVFGGNPLLVNTGRTPAQKIKFKCRAAILSVPLPREFHLPEGIDENTGESMLGPQQSANMFSVVDGFQPDNEVANIKNGFMGRGLYVWGLITYEDIFKQPHETRFCQHLYWDQRGDVRGIYVLGRNEAT
jgi:hypothetical protein